MLLKASAGAEPVGAAVAVSSAGRNLALWQPSIPNDTISDNSGCF